MGKSYWLKAYTSRTSDFVAVIIDYEGVATQGEFLLRPVDALRKSQKLGTTGGSIGFHHVLAACGTTAGDLNDLDNLPLGPLTESEGAELAQRLLLGIRGAAAEGAVDRLIERTGSIPYLLHKVASLLDDGSGSPVTGVDIDEAFEEFIDDPDEFQSFAHLLTRLEPNYGADAKLARQILNEALSADNAWFEIEGLRSGIDQPERFDDVLADLVSDHYLTQRGRSVRWRYPALQYIWARRAMIWDRP